MNRPALVAPGRRLDLGATVSTTAFTVMASRTRRTARTAAIVGMLAVVLLLAGCSTAHYPVNRPLTASAEHPGYRMSSLRPDARNSDSLFVSVSISGGGYRAAAYGLGVLQAMREIRLQWAGRETTLLDEVDVISGVSGGSILAAFVAAKGTDALDAFASEVLAKDLQSKLTTRILSPRGLWRLTSKRYGRSDLLAELLDDEIFHGAVLGDITRRGRRPYLIISASDMSTTERFEFTQDQFDRLCSDASAFPVARAVAASSAIPLVLSPVTLWNHARRCERPELRAVADARSFRHLVDGGLADNMSARTTIDYVGRFGDLREAVRAAGFSGVKAALFVQVDAEAPSSLAADDTADVPGLARSALAIVDVPIKRYSAESVASLRRAVAEWQRELTSAHDMPGDPAIFAANPLFLMIAVSLAQTATQPDGQWPMAIPTSLRIDGEARQALQTAGRTAFLAAPELAQLVALGRAPAASNLNETE